MKRSELTLEDLLAMVQQHGQDSEPDHEVGDLHDLCTAMWAVLTSAQRRQVVASEEVSDLIESACVEVEPEAAPRRTDDPVSKLSREGLENIVRRVRKALWWDDRRGQWDPDKDWTADTCVEAGAPLEENGLRPAKADLQALREAAADEAWEGYDLGDVGVVQGMNGWEYARGHDQWSCVFFTASAEKDHPSERHVFVVRFKPGTAEVTVTEVS